MMLYHDQYAALSRLDDHDFRVVLDALIRYSMTGERVAPDGYIAVIFDLMADKVARDIDEYDKRVERRKDAAHKRWHDKAPNAADGKPDNQHFSTMQCNAMQCNADKCNANEGNYISNGNYNHNYKQNYISLPLPPQGEGEKGEKNPDVNEVMEYAKSAGCDQCDEVLARRFITQQDATGWKDSNGKPIRNWRTWFSGWYARNVVNAAARPEPTSMQYEQRTYTPEALDRLTTAWMEDDDDG